MKKQAETASLQIKLITFTGVEVEVSSYVGDAASEELTRRGGGMLAALNAAAMVLQGVGLTGGGDTAGEPDQDEPSPTQPPDGDFPN